tara:strand:+ start:5582 stop:5953 length:372 start_codon:yes stop_codon:yes gene_type:complete
MRIPKKYGESKNEGCPFCGKQGIMKNSQGMPVCKDHRGSELKDMKCVCGEWLDLLDGKYGPYFRCMNCGNINFNKGMEMNRGQSFLSPSLQSGKEKLDQKKSGSVSEPKKEITVRSDEVDALY